MTIFCQRCVPVCTEIKSTRIMNGSKSINDIAYITKYTCIFSEKGTSIVLHILVSPFNLDYPLGVCLRLGSFFFISLSQSKKVLIFFLSHIDKNLLMTFFLFISFSYSNSLRTCECEDDEIT